MNDDSFEAATLGKTGYIYEAEDGGLHYFPYEKSLPGKLHEQAVVTVPPGAKFWFVDENELSTISTNVVHKFVNHAKSYTA